MSNDLGFGKPLDVSGFKPQPRKQTPEGSEEVGEGVAEKHGFVSREASTRVKKTNSNEPQDNVYVRAPLSVINAFKEYCITNRLSYGEALGDFLKIATGEQKR